jgi:mRNA interferase MazF
VQRGQVWWARFDEQHPVVLLSDPPDSDAPDDDTLDASGVRAVQIVAATGMNVGGLGLEVTVGTLPDLPSDAVVRVAFSRPGFVPCTWVTTLGANDLVECIGTLSSGKLSEIDEALALADGVLSAEDADHDEATAALAAIRHALRQGTVATHQIQRVFSQKEA